jgi:DNA-binding response OmpR family regulator
MGVNMQASSNNHTKFEQNEPKFDSGIEVLLIDDEPDILEALTETFHNHSISCASADTGEKAIAAFKKLKPKLIVSDYNMPGFNGLELYRILKDIGNLASVVWLTGNSTPDIIKDAWLSGVLNIFQKPFEVPELVKHVKSYLKMTPEELIELKPRYLSNLNLTHVSIDLDTSLYNEVLDECIKSSISFSRLINDMLKKRSK